MPPSPKPKADDPVQDEEGEVSETKQEVRIFVDPRAGHNNRETWWSVESRDFIGQGQTLNEALDAFEVNVEHDG